MLCCLGSVCVCLGGWLALVRKRFVLVMWQACLLVVLWWGLSVFFLVRRLVVESGLGGLSVEGGAGCWVWWWFFLGAVWLYLVVGSTVAGWCGGLFCLLVAFGVCVFCFPLVHVSVFI